MNKTSQTNIFTVSGGSMYPYLQEGDLVLNSHDKNFSFGDLILFEKDQKVFIHRYLGKELFKGDSLKRFDQEYQVPLTILGKVDIRIVNNQLIPFKKNFLVNLLSWFSYLNHAQVRVFHRAAAFIVKQLGNKLRQMELKNV